MFKCDTTLVNEAYDREKMITITSYDESRTSKRNTIDGLEKSIKNLQLNFEENKNTIQTLINDIEGATRKMTFEELYRNEHPKRGHIDRVHQSGCNRRTCIMS